MVVKIIYYHGKNCDQAIICSIDLCKVSDIPCVIEKMTVLTGGLFMIRKYYPKSKIKDTSSFIEEKIYFIIDLSFGCLINISCIYFS